MRFLPLLTLLVCASQVFGGDYYVTPAGSGDGTGGSDANSMSYSVLFQKALGVGDRVYFKAGEVYAGQHSAKSGVSYGRYGDGANPILSGFTALTSWTPRGDAGGGSVYYAELTGARYHGVTLDGVVQRMGRHPNSGYLTYTGTNAVQDNPATVANEFALATRITGETIKALPFDAVGAEVCIRKYRWVIDRHVVTRHAEDVLEYSSTQFYGNNKAYNPYAGNGYFIQNHLATLDQEGEWCFDAERGRLSMHFGKGTPAGRTVKVSTLDQVAPLNGVADVTFSDIDFEGGNTAVVINNSKDVTLNNCNFRQQGTAAVHGSGATRFTMKGGSIRGALNNAIDFPIGATDVTIDGVTVSDSGVIPGAGFSGDGGYAGIFVVGTGTTVTHCVVKNTGYNAVHVNGGGVRVEENVIDRFCTVKDDGAGVYTYRGDNAASAETIIRRNVVLHAVGAYAGAESFSYEAFGKAAGIYIDGYSNHVLVDANIVAHGEWGGIFLNGNAHNQVTNNTVYDFASQLLIHAHTAKGLVRSLTVTGNEFVARTPKQRTLELNLHVDDDIGSFGTFDKNRYARPIAEGATIVINRAYPGGKGLTEIDLATWRKTYGLDASSKVSAVTTDRPDRIRLDYAAAAPVTIALTGSWKDVSGATYTGRLGLDKYSGKILIADAPTTGAARPAIGR